MAEGQIPRKPHQLNCFKEQFDKQLTCSVCLEQYTNPKILPCHHSFCLTCIERVPVEIKDGKYYISCPSCRVDHQLPQGVANNLPNDFKINTLLDLREKFITTPEEKLVPTPNPMESTCPKHNDLLKTVYCETCCQIICQGCSTSTEHKDHTFYLISECYPKHHQQILNNLIPVKHKLADVNTAMTHLATREKEVVQQGENIKEEINEYAERLINNIQRSRTHLTQQVDTIVQQKAQTLATQRQQAQKLHTQLQTCQDTIEHNLKEWTQQQILTQKHTMMNEMSTATQHVDPTVFQPIENADIEFSKKTNGIEIGIITSKMYSKVILETSPCLAKQPSAATLTLQSQDGSSFLAPPFIVSSTLSSPGNKHSSVKCSIIRTRPGKHSIVFTPLTRRDHLIVQVGGVDVPDSPFTLPVIPTLEMRGEPVNIITGLNKPKGIAVCDNGDIVVAEWGSDRIVIVNKEGEKLKSFRRRMGTNAEQGKFTGPRGVAISNNGHILVTDKHQLQKLTTDGMCIKSVGSSVKGSGQSQFDCPAGIAVHPTTGQIFVADSKNQRIQVFANNLTFSHTITPSGLFQRFNTACKIAIDNEGYLYIAERDNHCISKLSDKGKCVKRFGSKGPAPGQLSCPSSLTIHHDLVYVCECGNNRVSVFDTDGRYIRHFGEHHMVLPRGITIDTLGNLYVSDTDNNRIVVF